MKDYRGYTGVNTKDKLIRDAEWMVEKSLCDPFASTETIVAPNGDTSKQFSTNIQVFQRYDANGKAVKVIGRIGEIERGNYLFFKDETWLVVTKPEDNGAFRKAEAELCTTSLPLKENDKEIIVGIDKLGRPIPKLIKGEVVLLPCVVKISDASRAIADVNQPINLLGNILYVTIPYRESVSIKYDEIFTMYGDQYRIIRIDQSDSINGIGILKITGERVGKGGSK